MGSDSGTTRPPANGGRLEKRMASTFEHALLLNGTAVHRRTGVDPETFAEMNAVLPGREASKGTSGRPPVLPVGTLLLSALECWRASRPSFHPGRE